MKKRVIPCLFLKNGFIIRSEKFSIHQLIGNPINELERFSQWAVDEIAYINISKDDVYDIRRSEHKVKIPNNRFELLKEISKKCFVPLSFGGGIRTLKDIEMTLQCGADKVILNSILFYDKSFVLDAVRVFGSQALVASVDYIGDLVYHSYGKICSNYSVLQWCRQLEMEGIGEIILNSISRDGTAQGYDTVTIKLVVDGVNIPVIALGGAGDYYDFVECFEKADPAAVAAGNIFHFKEHSDYHIKKALISANINVRRGAETALG
ncbi:MAG: imidazole glycerol phosphate synthase subunit HisF [Nitrospirae bacterium]|nr:imidazole glycerol phosphate synthase subunit HisF [Nitrospirota bacterium]